MQVVQVMRVMKVVQVEFRNAERNPESEAIRDRAGFAGHAVVQVVQVLQVLQVKKSVTLGLEFICLTN